MGQLRQGDYFSFDVRRNCVSFIFNHKYQNLKEIEKGGGDMKKDHN